MSTIKDYHSIHNPNYHLTLFINSKRIIITDSTSKELEKDLIRISDNYSIILQEWYHDNNHTHVLISGKPNNNSKFLNSYKTASSRLIKKNHPEGREYLWKEAFWSKKYYLATTGGVSSTTLKNRHSQSR